MKQLRNAPPRANSRPPVTMGNPAGVPQTLPAPTPSLIFGAADGPDMWLAAARAAVLDLLAAAREGARRPRKRVLARAEIRRQAREAFAGASTLLDEAAEALRAAAPLMTGRQSRPQS